MNRFEKVKSKLNTIWEAIVRFIKKYDLIIFAIIFFAIALVIRLSFLDFESDDYKYFLSHWYQEVENQGGFASFKTQIGDYTPAYRYIIIFLTLFNKNPLHMYKAVSIIFDFVLAGFVGLLIKHITKNNLLTLLAYATILFLPNVFFNSAIWAQCDVIFTTFIIISLYFILKDKSHLAMAFYAVSLSFKLQAIFFLPVIVVLIFKKKINLFSIITFMLTYMLIPIPAVIAGANYFDALIGIYINQAGEYSQLVLNAPNIYAIFKNTPQELSKMFTWMSLGFVGIICVVLYKYELEYDDRTIILIAYIFSLIIPFILPHMHERYFYLSDILGILFMFTNIKKIYIPIITILSSFLVVEKILFGWNGTFITLELDGIIMLLGIVLLLIHSIKYLKENHEFYLKEIEVN